MVVRQCAGIALDLESTIAADGPRAGWSVVGSRHCNRVVLTVGGEGESGGRGKR